MIESLAAISVFVQVAEIKSFVGAGRVLGLTASAVGKRISRFEKELGIQLFNRTTRSISLTHEGNVLLARSRRILDELNELQYELSNSAQEPQGRLKISLAPITDIFLDYLSKFNEQYPDIELELDYSARNVDLAQEAFDAAIRVGYIPDNNLRSHHLGNFRRLIVASPMYLEKNEIPITPSDLTNHKLLHYRSPNTGIIEPWSVELTRETHLSTSIVCNDLNARIDFALKGLGIACLPDIAIQHYLDQKLLIPILNDYTTDTIQIHAIWLHSAQYSMRKKVLINFLKNIII
ncbi:LysR family transcriptional regulator [Xenorhabdus kozodoii]|uniref:LysR family transcriptional regulator n=1 Tax=Xenorhabdus kozodoii TaxID=351676 RepID=A0A2D0LGW0_9GAMM|nr:LysR family transcriptional regulator [Xenorhabdus kozodoii]PHM74875.1 LysR family transcriptional regulator [Xenorhabdus kozodoii]